jgi:hypothetical protein
LTDAGYARRSIGGGDAFSKGSTTLVADRAHAGFPHEKNIGVVGGKTSSV